MAKYNFMTPLSEKTVRELHVNDTVTLNGTIFGVRIRSLSRILDQMMDPPVSLQGAVCVLLPEPGIKKAGSRWEKVIVGTSTSKPMERAVPVLIEKYGVRAIIGRAGLSEQSLEVMKKYGACYFAYPGGAAALFTNSIVEVEAVHWEDLHPEGFYQYKVKDWEGFSVTMDSHGRDLYTEMKTQLEKRLPEIYKKLQIPF